MRYEDADCRYIRSTMQEIGYQDIGALRAEMRRQYREQMYSGHNMPKSASPMKTLLMIGGLAAVIYLAFSRGEQTSASSRGLFIICLAALIFAVISKSFFKGSLATAEMHDRTAAWVSGLFSAVVVIAMPAMYYFLPFENGSEKTYFIAGTFLGSLGLLFLIKMLMIMTEKIRIYRMSVSATCTGYIRKITRVSDNTVTRNVISSSPLFSYEADGSHIEAFYDLLPYGMCVPVALGDIVTINVDPKDPGYVMAPAGKRIVKNILPALILLAAGLILIYGVLNGAVKGSSFNFTFGA